MKPEKSSENSNSSNSKHGEVIIEGAVTKSPPHDRIDKIGSWHERYMVLLKISHQNLKNVKGQKGSFKKKEKISTHYCLTYWASQKDKIKGGKPIRE